MDSVNTQWQPCKNLPHFFKCYSKAIVVLVLLVVSLLYIGYRWRVHQQAAQAQLATAYTQILPLFSVPHAPAATEKRSNEQPASEELSGEKLRQTPADEKVAVPAEESTMKSTVEQFIQQNSQHAYGVLAAMQWAKYWVDRQDYEQAVTQLTIALNHARDANLKAILQLRLASLQWQLKQPEKALAILELAQDTMKKQPVWWTQAQYLRANILQHQHDLRGASAAYQHLLASKVPVALQPLAMQQAVIKMQINDIADSTEQATK